MKRMNTHLHNKLIHASFWAMLPLATPYAQSIELTGSNGMYSGGCSYISPVPKTCATQVFTATIPAATSPDWSLPTVFSSALIIGTNLTDSLTGPTTSGGLKLLGGAKGTGAYLYLAYEPNTTGSMDISGSGSSWTGSSAGIVGLYGHGTLNVTDGGLYRQLNSDHFHIGSQLGSKGEVLVNGVNADGTRSKIDVRNRIIVGEYGEGTLRIEKGGWVDSGYTIFVSYNANSTGYLYVDGVDTATGIRSTLTSKNNNLQIGDLSYGVVNITDGGLVDIPNYGTLGSGATGIGVLNVDGVNAQTGLRSTIEVGANAVGIFMLGGQGQGTVNITGGALGISDTNFFIGYNVGGRGVLNITGTNSEFLALERAVIGYRSDSTLTVAQGGKFSAKLLEAATNDTSRALIQVGDGDLSGTLDVPEIRGGLGQATLSFNHSDDISFAPLITGSMSVTKLGSGVTTLTGNNTYTGTTTLRGGVLAAGGLNTLSSTSQYNVDAGGTLVLNSYSHELLAVNNAGTVTLGQTNNPSTPNTVLSITTDYVGSGGVVQLNSQLGNDASPSDQLIIQGNTTGNSQIKVVNVGGRGALTAEGIQLIGINGASDATFTLKGDYTAPNGQGAVVGGAYAYQLYKGNASGTENKGWYLRSEIIIPPSPEPKPLYQAGVPLYESYGQVLLGLNGLPSLQQRVGNRITDSSSTSTGPSYRADPTAAIKQEGSWARIDTWHTKVNPNTSTSNSKYDYSAIKLQVGHDFVLQRSDTHALFSGVNVYYTGANANINSPYGAGDINTSGYGLGGTLTWYGKHGIYVDTQASATWYSSSLYSDTASRNLIKDNAGFGYALSAELGQRFALSEQWSITPQIQLQYSNVSFDQFNDTFGAQVNSKNASSLLGRLGVSAAYQQTANDIHGNVERGLVYGVMNIYNEFLGNAKVNVSGVEFSSQPDRLWAGVGMGGAYYWNDGQYAVYGEASVNTSLQHFGDSYSLRGMVGFRMTW